MNDPRSISSRPSNQLEATSPDRGAVAAVQRPFGDALSCLPAYLALFTAIGAGCYALGSALSYSGISAYLWYALIVNVLISFGLQCGSTPVQRFCRWARVLSLIFVPLLTLLLNSALMAPLDAEAAVNEMVALMIGGVTVMSVLAIGASFADHTVPIAAPLVPALSFFGLLNSLSVNTITQVCFIIFAAAAIYLVAYERMLARRNSESIRMSRHDTCGYAAAVGRTAGRYLAACSVWFMLFLAATAVLYYPMDVILPQIISDPWSRARRGRGPAATDWRGSSGVVHLRGGYTTLSDTVIMQVTMNSVPPALWRGRVYEHYSGSMWSVNPKDAVMNDLHPLNLTRLTIPQPATSFKLPAISPDLVREGDIIDAFIEPENAPFRNLFFPGRALGVQTQNDISQLAVDPDGVVTVPGSYRALVWPYNIRARLPEESPAALLQAPGLTASALRQWRSDPATSSTLELLPDRQTGRNRIRAIAIEIQQKAKAAGRPMETPYEKGVAIRDFLTSGYTYSLASPPVPINEDAVVFFLTNSRQGACDMFASAAALLLRAMDVPARLATGYIATEVADADSSAASENADGSTAQRGVEMRFPLRERDAHAWVEYFVPRAGWLTMDPTEGTRTTEVPLQTQIAQLLRLPELTISWRMLVLPAVGLVLLTVGLLWPMLTGRDSKSTANTPADAQRIRIADAYNRAVRLLKRRVPHRLHYTPQEYEAAVAASEIPLAARQEFAALTYLSVAARYATSPPAVAQSELETSLQRLQQGLK